MKINSIIFSEIHPTIATSINKSWAKMNPPPVGILDQLVSTNNKQ